MIVFIASIVLIVGLLSGCVEEETEETPENSAPLVSFTYEVNETTKTVTFTGSATDADDDDLTYSWDFDDGETSTDLSPTHTYADNGTYTVTFTADDGTDTNTYSDDIEINVVPVTMPTAMFTYDPMVNITNTTEVTFTDNSTLGDATNLTYSWDFDGDGVEDSTEPSPTYTFTTVGTYNVTLTVTDEIDTTLTDVSDVTAIEVVATE